ncbi:hypothetical protein RhiJN_09149 [Ceratobasidium sp. AG-Ba]|nr:hypothetical protein RhiJN_09149 [Ceratobasidium sp. AG-Ba]
MPIIVDDIFVTSPVPIEDGVWSTKAIFLEDTSSLADFTWPGLTLDMASPPGSPTPIPTSKSFAAPRPNTKPKGPRPQPIKTDLKIDRSEPNSPCTSGNPLFSPKFIRPPRKTRGLYGDHPRLPSHRPSHYIPEHPCNGDRFAHLTEFRTSRVPTINQHSKVCLSTMGLERFWMTEPEQKIETECMNEKDEAGFLWSLDTASVSSASTNAIKLNFGAGGLKGALSNFRARFGGGPGVEKKSLSEPSRPEQVDVA